MSMLVSNVSYVLSQVIVIDEAYFNVNRKYPVLTIIGYLLVFPGVIPANYTVENNSIVRFC